MIGVALALWLGVAQALASSTPEPEPVTVHEVMVMVAAVPAMCPGNKPCADRPGMFDLVPTARAIAEGIAAAASEETETVLGTSREDAALLVVFACRESGLRITAVGDGGKSLGPWQLQATRAGIALTPRLAAREWLRRAREAMRTCAEDAPSERLALLASGRCDRGRALSAHRVQLAERISAETETR